MADYIPGAAFDLFFKNIRLRFYPRVTNEDKWNMGLTVSVGRSPITPPEEGPSTGQEDLPASVWATRCLRRITFRKTCRGKRTRFALKWETGKEGGESPRSEMKNPRAGSGVWTTPSNEEPRSKLLGIFVG
jgi:hypothetical protein